MSLAALVIADAGSATQLAWLGAGLAALLLAGGLLGGSFTAVHGAIAVTANAVPVRAPITASPIWLTPLSSID